MTLHRHDAVAGHLIGSHFFFAKTGLFISRCFRRDDKRALLRSLYPNREEKYEIFIQQTG